MSSRGSACGDGSGRMKQTARLERASRYPAAAMSPRRCGLLERRDGNSASGGAGT